MRRVTAIFTAFILAWAVICLGAPGDAPAQNSSSRIVYQEDVVEASGVTDSTLYTKDAKYSLSANIRVIGPDGRNASLNGIGAGDKVRIRFYNPDGAENTPPVVVRLIILPVTPD